MDTRLQRRAERLLAYNLPPGEVDQKGGGLHQANFASFTNPSSPGSAVCGGRTTSACRKTSVHLRTERDAKLPRLFRRDIGDHRRSPSCCRPRPRARNHRNRSCRPRPVRGFCRRDQRPCSCLRILQRPSRIARHRRPRALGGGAPMTVTVCSATDRGVGIGGVDDHDSLLRLPHFDIDICSKPTPLPADDLEPFLPPR